MPGTAGGTVRRQVRTVNFATSPGIAVGASSPACHQTHIQRSRLWHSTRCTKHLHGSEIVNYHLLEAAAGVVSGVLT